MTRPGVPRVLLAGAGVMGSHHGRILAESPRCELVAVVDPAQDRGQALAERFGADWLPTIGNLSTVDAVVIASSTDQHRGIASDVLAEDIPLFVEKPLCASLADSRELIDTALRRGVPLMCGFVERFNPAVRQALSLVEDPRSVQTQRFSGYSARMHAGVTWDLLVHDIDISLRIFPAGVPKVVNATIIRKGSRDRIGEDTVEVDLEFPGSRTAALTASRVSPRRERRLTIREGSRTIVADLLHQSVRVYSQPVSHLLQKDDVSRGGDFSACLDCSGRREPLAAQWDRFADILEGRVDAQAETRSILPSHEAVATILDSAEELKSGD
ncbi:Gfo/Idh/MocA family oxidoreductase [Streptomyces sp. NPDC006552]|uniref:Gfo/Idh/MocA family protein n=1 Tax=Streptomyces sp. NPDC006552 TaxID=3157179 RepID=UPI0033B83B7F